MVKLIFSAEYYEAKERQASGAAPSMKQQQSINTEMIVNLKTIEIRSITLKRSPLLDCVKIDSWRGSDCAHARS